MRSRPAGSWLTRALPTVDPLSIAVWRPPAVLSQDRSLPHASARQRPPASHKIPRHATPPPLPASHYQLAESELPMSEPSADKRPAVVAAAPEPPAEATGQEVAAG